MKQLVISPSILSADFGHLAQECKDVIAAGAGSIHFDVMDHHFVPNLSFGAVVCDSLRKAGVDSFIDVHLMVEKPEQYVEAFAKAGASLISFHPETTEDVAATVDLIVQHGMQAGLVFNPDKPVDVAPELMSKLSMILLMSVYPGFSGQSFIPDVLDKLKQTRAMIDAGNYDMYLAIDGGVKLDNIKQVVGAGADFVVMGSAVFKSSDYKRFFQEVSTTLSS